PPAGGARPRRRRARKRPSRHRGAAGGGGREFRGPRVRRTADRHLLRSGRQPVGTARRVGVMKDVAGKVAVVTGGGFGIGKAAGAATKNAGLSLMESLYGYLRDQGSKIRAGCVFPPLTRSNMGSPEVEAYLKSSGVPAVLAEPEELAQVVLEGIKNDVFFINPTHEQDGRIFGGKLKPNADWQDEMVMNKAKAMIERRT